MLYARWQESNEQQLESERQQQICWATAGSSCSRVQRRHPWQVVRIHTEPWQHPALVSCTVCNHNTAGKDAIHIFMFCHRPVSVCGHHVQAIAECHSALICGRIYRVGAPMGRQRSRRAASVASQGKLPPSRWTGTMWTACSPTAAGGNVHVTHCAAVCMCACTCCT